MAAIHIPDALDHSLQRAADELGQPKEALIHDLLQQHVEEYLDPELTEAQIARMRESIAQLNRGEIVTSEEVEARFAAWRSERDAR